MTPFLYFLLPPSLHSLLILLVFLQIASPSPGCRFEWPPGLCLYIFVARSSTLTFDLYLALAQNTLYIQVVWQDNLSYLISSDIHVLKKLGILMRLDKLDVL